MTKKKCSERGIDWIVFQVAVWEHIEQYTVPQYGDKGGDLATEYTVEQCMQQIKKYASRFGKNQRDGQQNLDFLKIAHYAQMAWSIENDKKTNS